MDSTMELKGRSYIRMPRDLLKMSNFFQDQGEDPALSAGAWVPLQQD
jgi:hypothetical protein